MRAIRNEQTSGLQWANLIPVVAVFLFGCTTYSVYRIVYTKCFTASKLVDFQLLQIISSDSCSIAYDYIRLASYPIMAFSSFTSFNIAFDIFLFLPHHINMAAFPSLIPHTISKSYYTLSTKNDKKYDNLYYALRCAVHTRMLIQREKSNSVALHSLGNAPVEKILRRIAFLLLLLLIISSHRATYQLLFIWLRSYFPATSAIWKRIQYSKHLTFELVTIQL